MKAIGLIIAFISVSFASFLIGAEDGRYVGTSAARQQRYLAQVWKVKGGALTGRVLDSKFYFSAGDMDEMSLIDFDSVIEIKKVTKK